MENFEEELYDAEHHVHTLERWFGLAASPSGETHRADPMADANAFQIDAGNDAFGSWVQILGSSDTPCMSGVKFDPHRIAIAATERSTPYLIQFGFGTVSGGVLTGTYTEVPFCPTGITGEQATVDVRTPPVAVGTKVWARCKCKGANTGTFDFYVGLHEYDDSDIKPVFDNTLAFIDIDGTEQAESVAGMISAMFGVMRRYMKEVPE